ncbi:MAG: tetratricopeptide repeat protein [Bacteriovoracia bacterium]
MDSNQNASLALRSLAAVALALGIFFFLAATSWSAEAAYTDEELRAVQTSRESQIRSIHDQEIKTIRIALGRRLPTNRMADLYFRLAEIYLEAYRAAFLLEGRVHERRLENGTPDKLIDRTHSRKFLAAGIQACKEILAFNIPFEKMDRVYYFLTFNYDELGDRKRSLLYAQLLTDKFPRSPFVVEAYRYLGNEAFRQNELPKAQAYFELALRARPNDLLPGIYHRLAWAYYRTKQYSRAVETMKRAVAQASTSEEKFLSIREEALRDMAIFMTEQGQVEEAIAYFQKVAGDKSYFPKTLERLGREFERRVQPDKAAIVYESLLRTNPNSATHFRVSVKLVDLDLRRKRYNPALERIRKLDIPSLGDDDTSAALQNLRAMVRRTATEHHEEFRKKADRDSLKIAEAYYEAYLGYFLKRDDPRRETPEVQMYVAEVKRELGKPEQSTGYYHEVVKSKDPRYTKEAAALWVGTLSDAIQKYAKANPKSKSARSEKPTELEKTFVEASDELQDILPGSPEARAAALQSAQFLADYKDTQDSAVSRARKIVKDAPSTKQAIVAAKLWLQVAADRLPDPKQAETKRYVAAAHELAEVNQEIRGNRALMDYDARENSGHLKKQIDDLEHRLRVGEIAVYEKEKDFASAGKAYETFAANAGSTDLSEKAYTNALGSFAKSGDWDAMDRLANQWLDKYPNSRAAYAEAKGTATSLLIQGYFSPSAALFRRLGRQGTDAASLETAVRIYEGTEEVSKAQAARDDALKIYKNGTDRWATLLQMGRAFERQGKESEAERAYASCAQGKVVPVEFRAECGSRMGDLQARLKDPRRAIASFQGVSTLPGRAGEGRSPFIGYARYRIAEILEEETKFSPLVLPETALQKALTERLSFFERLSKAYLAALDVGGPWAIASLYRLAKWTNTFASEVDRIQPPDGSQPKAIEKFRKSLFDVSNPLRKKAAETWSQAYQKAVEAEIYSPAVPETVDELADLGVRPPHRAQGARGRYRLAGAAGDSAEGVRKKLMHNPKDAAAWIEYGNVLMGSGKPLLADVAYARALELEPRNVAAFNNQGVVLLGGEGPEDWLRAARASYLFKQALKGDHYHDAAKLNLASLMNYYRLFRKAKPLWQQIHAKTKGRGADAPWIYDGLATVHFGTGDVETAQAYLGKARDAGAEKGRFAQAYHEAAAQAERAAVSKNPEQVAEYAGECLSALKRLDGDAGGFEKSAVMHLEGSCKAWKQ